MTDETPTDGVSESVARLADLGVDRITLTTSGGDTFPVNIGTGEQGITPDQAEAAVRRAIDDVIDGDLTDGQRDRIRQAFEQVLAGTVRERHERRVDAEQRATAMRLFPVAEQIPVEVVSSTFRLKAPKGPIASLDSEGDVDGPVRIAVQSGIVDPVDLVHLPIGSRVRLEIDAFVTGFNPTATLEDAEEGTVHDGKIAHTLECGKVRIVGVRRKGERAALGEIRLGPRIVKLPDAEPEPEGGAS